jgi:hypothetical protein
MSDIEIIKYDFMGTNEDLEKLSIISNGYNNDLLPISQIPLTYFPIYNNMYINKLLNLTRRIPKLENINIITNKSSVESISTPEHIYIKFTSTDETIFEVKENIENVTIFIVNGGSLTTAGDNRQKTDYHLLKGKYKVKVGEGQKKNYQLHERNETTFMKIVNPVNENIHTIIFNQPLSATSIKIPSINGIAFITKESNIYYGKQITYNETNTYTTKTSVITDGTFIFRNTGSIYINNVEILDKSEYVNNVTYKIYIDNENKKVYIYKNEDSLTLDIIQNYIKIKYPYFEYNFDDISKVGKDSSVNENHLISLGDRRISINRNNELIFNGNGYLEKGFTNYLYSPDRFSISFWFRASENDFNNITNKSIIFGCSSNPDDFYNFGGWAVIFEQKTIKLLTYNGTTYKITDYVISIENHSILYHIVIIFDKINNSNFIKMYKNKVRIKFLDAENYSKISTGKFFIGKSINMENEIGASKLNGSSIKDLRIYRDELTVNDITKIYNYDYVRYDLKEYYSYTNLSTENINDKLKAWYKFDDSNDIGKDSIGGEVNKLSYTQRKYLFIQDRPEPMKLNNVYKIKGVSSLSYGYDGYLSNYFTNSLFSPIIFSISFWFKAIEDNLRYVVDSPYIYMILGCDSMKENAINQKWCISLYLGRICILISNDDNTLADMVASPVIDSTQLMKWNHIVFTINDRKQVNLYVNKAKYSKECPQYNKNERGFFFIGNMPNKGENDAFSSFTIGSTPESFGNRLNNNSFLDDLRIYHHELVEKDVEELYIDRVETQTLENSQTVIDKQENTGSNGKKDIVDGKKGVLIIKYANKTAYNTQIIDSIDKIEGENLKKLNKINEEFDIKIKQIELDNDKPYNRYNIYPLTIIITITWILLIILILKYISYYYSSYYIYVLITIIIIILLISSIWFLYVNNDLVI